METKTSLEEGDNTRTPPCSPRYRSRCPSPEPKYKRWSRYRDKSPFRAEFEAWVHRWASSFSSSSVSSSPCLSEGSDHSDITDSTASSASTVSTISTTSEEEAPQRTPKQIASIQAKLQLMIRMMILYPQVCPLIQLMSNSIRGSSSRKRKECF